MAAFASAQCLPTRCDILNWRNTMELKKEVLEQRKAMLTQQFEASKANANALQGAMQDCDFWLNQIDLEEQKAANAAVDAAVAADKAANAAAEANQASAPIDPKKIQ
jgi:hypothetical protein